MSVDIDKMYAGLSHAETGSFQNPYIRTTDNTSKGGSTAFGPVQITYKLAQGADKNGYLSPDSKIFYEQVMKPKYEQMLKHGNNSGKIPDYNPIYDYGGNAGFDPTQHSQDYEQFAKDIIAGVAKESGGNEGTFIQKWRGQSVNQDPSYYQKVQLGKKLFTNELSGVK